MYLRRVAVLVLIPLVMVCGCGAESSERSQGRHPTSHLRLEDGVGDVFLADSSDTDDVARTVRNVDVVAADIRRTRGALRVAITYDDLAARASKAWLVSFDVVTSEDHVTRTVLWERGQYPDTGAWHQGVSIEKVSVEDSLGSGCRRAATAKVAYANATVTIRVPNHCLGNPTWMRLDNLVARSRAPHGINDYADNPFNATGISESTPRLMRPAS